ncbi:hypothetical protein [Paenibacillus sp. HGF5]|uniref:hypothetical protein n=1 Tax=Paenibacillus sp. HGF5 TaxID=908341 RepID=UPI0002072676|nr:hypothetical protein [Paenibacillus sp. HGF5]EGG33423.1 hypothetical protein HMPREF9412_1422 [Paenibacillus sp. HGF5]
MLQQALQKLQKEVGEKHDKKYVQHVGAFLISYVRKHPEHAAFILTEGKTISASIGMMRSEAMKNDGVLTDEEGFNIALKYFGIPIQNEQQAVEIPELNVSSIDDLL